MSEDKTGGLPPGGEELSGKTPGQTTPPGETSANELQPVDEGAGTIDNPYVDSPYADDPYGGAGASGSPESMAVSTPVTAVVPAGSAGGQPPPRKPPPLPPPEEEEEGMLRMSFMDHLSELRKRIIMSLYGFGVAFLASLVFANELWRVISDPAVE